MNDIRDETMDQLKSVASSSSAGGAALSEEDLKNLKRRKLVAQITRKSYKVSKGSQYQPRRVKRYADLTKEMLGNQQEVIFKNGILLLFLK